MTQAEVFAVICSLLDWRTDSLTKTERARIGRVARELREAGATIEMLRYGAKVTGPMFARMRERGVVPKAENVLDAWSEIERRWRAAARVAQEKQSERQRLQELEAEALPLEENRRRWRQLVKAMKLGRMSDLLDDV